MTPDRHPQEAETDPVLDAFADDLLRGAGPPTAPPGLKSRALEAARREMSGEASPSPSPLERWIGAVFTSRLFWTAWATAMILAFALGPPAAEPSRTELPVEAYALEAGDLDRPEAWIASASNRPRPTGPLLADAPSDLPLDLN